MKIKVIYFNRQTETYTMVVTDLKGNNETPEFSISNEVALGLIDQFRIEKYDTPDFIHYEL